MSNLSTPASHFGDRYLIYSGYPNGFPVYDIDESTAELVLKRFNPSERIDPDRYVFGRTYWKNHMVGAIVYPIKEEDTRSLRAVLNDPQLTQDQKDDLINERVGDLMAKDHGDIYVYDLGQGQIVLNTNEADDQEGAVQSLRDKANEEYNPEQADESEEIVEPETNQPSQPTWAPPRYSTQQSYSSPVYAGPQVVPSVSQYNPFFSPAIRPNVQGTTQPVLPFSYFEQVMQPPPLYSG